MHPIISCFLCFSSISPWFTSFGFGFINEDADVFGFVSFHEQFCFIAWTIYISGVSLKLSIALTTAP
jgi:hypothetical protein